MNVNVSVEELRKHKIFVATPMYGGSCFGTYLRSSIDLANLCRQYGISAQFYYLFNESLITRARNYLVDEFLRSDCNKLMFIDADIEYDPNHVLMLAYLDRDIIGAPYPKKCLSGKTKILTRDGKKTISSIVRTKYRGDVRSWDVNKNRWVWAPLTHHMRSDDTKSWIDVRTSDARRWTTLTCTTDHEVAVVDDLWNPTIRFVPANQTLGKFLVRDTTYGTSVKGMSKFNPLYNDVQLEILVGSLLGDGHINPTGRFMGSHCLAQEPYARYKQSLLGGSVIPLPTIRKHPGVRVSYPITDQTKALRTLAYPDGTKRVDELLSRLTTIGLAFWYMDDGSLCHPPKGGGRPYAVLCTNGFTYPEHELIVTTLKERWGLDATINKQGRGWKIRINADQTHELCRIIAPYVCESMEYKLLPEYWGGEKITLDSTPRPFGTQLVTAIVPAKSQSCYDITVEGTHNFVANGVVVHNCIAWENVLKAAKAGLADDDPRKLEQFVGDYVFNVAPGTTQFSIDEPLEVMETGTGFMMIDRKVFEGFRAAYPEYEFRPDHNRTEQFNGSRMIHAYFDTVIDPESRRYLSEDYMFCQWSRKIGYKVWLCPWMELKHTGTYIFGGSLRAIAQLTQIEAQRAVETPGPTIEQLPLNTLGIPEVVPQGIPSVGAGIVGEGSDGVAPQ